MFININKNVGMHTNIFKSSAQNRGAFGNVRYNNVCASNSANKETK